MNTLLVLLVVIVAILVLFLIIQQSRSKSYKGDGHALEYKNNYPILPRDQRPTAFAEQELPAKPQSDVVDEDPLSVLASFASQSKNKSQDEPTTGEVMVNLPNSFTQESPILNNHLGKEDNFDQNNDPLINAKDTVTIFITPRNQSTGISGKEIIKLSDVYGLKYGVMNMFHRYEHESGAGGLWFSMLGVTRDGIQSFDINAMPSQRFEGLSLFLSLPHPRATQGFTSMISTARMMAKDLNADLLDAEDYVINDDYINRLRLDVANYR